MIMILAVLCLGYEGVCSYDSWDEETFAEEASEDGDDNWRNFMGSSSGYLAEDEEGASGTDENETFLTPMATPRSNDQSPRHVRCPKIVRNYHLQTEGLEDVDARRLYREISILDPDVCRLEGCEQPFCHKFTDELGVALQNLSEYGPAHRNTIIAFLGLIKAEQNHGMTSTPLTYLKLATGLALAGEESAFEACIKRLDESYFHYFAINCFTERLLQGTWEELSRYRDQDTKDEVNKMLRRLEKFILDVNGQGESKLKHSSLSASQRTSAEDL